MPVREHEQPDRQGSASSGNSWRSQATIRNNEDMNKDQIHPTSHGRDVDAFPGTLTDNVQALDRYRTGSDSWIIEWMLTQILLCTRSGSSQAPKIDWGASMWSWSSPDISPTEERKGSGFSNHRKAMAVLGAARDETSRSSSSPRPPPIRQPRPGENEFESIAPWATSSGADGQRTFFNDFSEHEASPASATFRPTTGRTFSSEPADMEYNGDHRRPSTTSITSSTGSKSSLSQRWKKKTKGSVSEDYSVDEPGDGPNQPIRRGGPVDQLRARERANSDGSDASQRQSRSRAETPLPSSDITPWVYQSFNDIPQYGEAPVRPVPIGPDGQRLGSQGSAGKPRSATRDSSRRAGNGHRHSRSKEERPTLAGDLADYQFAGYQGRPSVGRDDFAVGLKPYQDSRLHSSTAMSSSTNLGGRSTSPTPSVQSAIYREHGHNSPGGPPNKQNILSKIGRFLPGHKPHDKSKRKHRRRLDPRLDTADSTKKESGKGLGIGGRKFPRRGFTLTGDGHPPRDGPQGEEGKHYFSLDTDLEDMRGVRTASPGRKPRGNDGTTTPREDLTRPDVLQAGGIGSDSWAAPDSWHVKKQADVVAEATENAPKPSAGVRERDGASYFIRIFRIDSTFATLSAGLNTSVADVLYMLGKKSFLQDHLNNYEIVLRKNDLSRQLDHKERPILMQKKLLEQVGYTEKDRIEDIGREDHSYLCRFVFLPTKLSGYTSLEADPGFNKMQKFSHVDLQGRSLVTIPITLYKKASEIISLNLSRNLSLDVPKDFIQSCINLREIKFIGNEALQLPLSFSLASRLTYLDISNNFLEELDHASLDQLTGLVSIKMANNQLTSLPSYFENFQYLRSLNMSSNSFKIFPEFLCNLRALVDLDISFNNIEGIPCIGELTTLERLWMTNNNISGPLDDSFQQLVNLREIDGRFNAISSIDNLCGLPRLEQVFFGHNLVSRFKGSAPKLRSLHLDHNPLTQFDIDSHMPTLSSLNLASANLSAFRDAIFENMPNVSKLILDKNHLSSIPAQIGKLRRLEHFSIIKNPLAFVPPQIGCLVELKEFNLRECNLKSLPEEIWHCAKLETLNVSTNLLTTFPKHGAPQPLVPGEPTTTPVTTPAITGNPSYEDLGPLDEQDVRRPSQTSNGALGSSSSPSGSNRNASIAPSIGQSQGGRKVSTASRSINTEGSSSSRKDSNFSQHTTTMTFAGSLRNLYLADNRLDDEVFRELARLPELRVVNLSYNELTELPQGVLRRWPWISELYLSGNELTSLPSDDLEEGSNLKVLHINANRFQVLPAELCKVSKLAILDVGSNGLKYNVSNWPYDWNWNWNRSLKYLNFSGNKRLEIKPNITSLGPPVTNGADLTDFTSLTHLRVLGLMDVTLTIPTIPEETEDRRVRTSASLAGSLAYGMADTLGRTEHLSIIDMIVPRLKPDNVETLVGMFDGSTMSSGGSRVAKYLHEHFTPTFSHELKRLQPDQDETPLDALRRAFLALNKNMAGSAYRSIDDRELRQYNRRSSNTKQLNQDDIQSGGVATVLYLNNMDLYAANVGDAQAILVKSDGSLRNLTQYHDPAEASERARIRAAGGFVARNGKLNDVLPVSRCFGHFPMMPAVIAAPYTMHTTLTEQDEMIIIASKELWDYVAPDLVVDATRAAHPDLMFAAQKLRDLAISFGATNKLMVMVLGVSELQKRQKKFSRPSMNLERSAFPEDQIVPKTKLRKRPRDAVGDTRLARFDRVDAPIGELAIIFTDIKKSTGLWETCPDAMRSAIQIHNDILRRQLGIIGGYEVKTEGDAFMVAFNSTTAALLWCFNCQNQLLEAEWPTEILEQPQCRIVYDMENNIIFRGLSVRMGGHWGEPVCENDPVTNRMDYFGPMVNRASRISAVADGGQIFVSSDFMSDIQRNLEVFADAERSASTSSNDSHPRMDSLGHTIRRELQQLNSQGFVIKDQGERKLKGLENPEPLYLVYPHSLAGRMTASEEAAQDSSANPAIIPAGSELDLKTDLIWRLWEVTLRLERLCGALENSSEPRLREPNVALFNMVKNHGGELNDSTVISLVDQQVTRIEAAINTLSVRHMLRPFQPGDRLEDHAVPIGEVMQQLQTQLAEYRALKEQMATGATGIPDETPPQYGGMNMHPSASAVSIPNSTSSSVMNRSGTPDTRSFDLQRSNR
ncbi:Adenylate cyclase [Penicillium argentinense]|uniref:Adenylate cyclase n=1 Tax=Penicillium argentinense TaxID=1131581 RepID=A0A9W9EXR5_9EURO|nr:Adenylate cyclase [Penicillium argentinense]KAJ5089800.1 Adenylate cyclase [Penicillium argentinense]